MTTTAPHRTGSLLVWAAAALLLLAPTVAMQFTPEVNWTASDFIIFAAMVVAAAGGYEFLARRGGSWTYRAAAALAVLAGFLLVWVNLAVGIIGSENNNANMMFAGVLAVAVGGSIVARARPAGMAAAMLATAVAQVAVAAIALTLRLGAEGPIWPRDVLGVTVLLTALWLASAGLLRRAG